MLLNLFEVVGMIFFLMMIGFILAKTNIVEERDSRSFSNLIIMVTAPALVFNSVLSSFDREMIISSYPIPFFALGMVVVMSGLAALVARYLYFENKDRRNIFIVTVGFCNNVFIGLPVVTSLYGSQTIGPIFLFDLGINLAVWTIGISIINGFDSQKLTSFVTNIFKPPMIALLLAIGLGMMEIYPGGFIMDLTEMVGNITIPLAVLSIGITVGKMEFDLKMLDSSMLVIIIMRLFISPLIMTLGVMFFGVPELTQKVVIIVSAMPAMVLIAILSRRYDKEYNYAAMAVFVTTVISLVTIPIVVYIIELIIG